ncbi:glutamate-1-semialdehyde 2,1-aminomutase [Pirellulaceae bacterium SH501]
MNFKQSEEWRRRAHAVIPGGCHTYAKGDDQYPQLSPGFITHGRGGHVWDIDGNEYIEFGQGNRAVALGHAFPPVVDAVMRELAKGSNFTRPSTIELEAAEELLALIPHADMVKFCKDGSDATTAAVKVARAVTGRSVIAYCSDHPFFATDDWFIGTTAIDAGIPDPIKQLSKPFQYDRIESLERLFREHPDEIAAVILEPSKYEDPAPNYLHQVKELCARNGALFILDEMITGFRWHNGGGQAYYGVAPDLSCWGKAMANGFSVSALAGKREYMELGGLHHSRERVFLLSTTHGGETHALAAAIATIRTYKSEPVVERLFQLGSRLLREGNQIIAGHGLSKFIQIEGKPCCLVYSTRDAQGERSQAMRSLLLQETIRRGILMTSLIVSYTHTDEDIDRTLDAIDQSLPIYKQALEQGTDQLLVGPPSKVVYRKYN